MDAKRIGIAAALIVVGIGGLLWQIDILKNEGYFYKIGGLCSVIIVFGFASLFLNFSDLTAEDGSGKQQSLSFSDMPTGWKVAFVLSILAGIGQFAYFEMGAPGL